ncbi:hypothetical protein DFAR_1120001 [Desulfarculales bacterium]
MGREGSLALALSLLEPPASPSLLINHKPFCPAPSPTIPKRRQGAAWLNAWQAPGPSFLPSNGFTRNSCVNPSLEELLSRLDKNSSPRATNRVSSLTAIGTCLLLQIILFEAPVGTIPAY